MQEQLKDEHKNILTKSITNSIIASIMQSAINQGNRHSVHSAKYEDAVNTQNSKKLIDKN